MNQTVLHRSTPKETKNYRTSSSRDTAKNEFFEGRLISKPAANRWHNLVVTNLAIAIGSRIHRSTCELYTSDMQVQIGKDSVCFPDVLVVNGEPTFADSRSEVLLNPTVLIKIFSPLSQAQDRTQELEGFLAIPKHQGLSAR